MSKGLTSFEKPVFLKS